MSWIFKLWAVGGVGLLIVLVILAIMALTGSFEHEVANPPT